MSDKAKDDKTARIGEILDVMRNTWDLPADCNEGELFAYAETLYDRIASGDRKGRALRLSGPRSGRQSRNAAVGHLQSDRRPRSGAGGRLALMKRSRRTPRVALPWAPSYGRNPDVRPAPLARLTMLQ